MLVGVLYFETIINEILNIVPGSNSNEIIASVLWKKNIHKMKRSQNCGNIE